MSETAPRPHIESAHLGQNARNEGFKKKIEASKKAIVNDRILNPRNSSERDAQNENAENLIRTLGQGSASVFEARSIKELIATEKDPNKLESQKQMAHERVDVLGKAVFGLMQYGGNERTVDMLGRGSIAEIESILPPPLKGLGESILSNIISDEIIVNELKTLDKKRERAAAAGAAGDKILASSIDQAIERLVDSDDNKIHEDQLQTVLAYLGSERLALDEKAEAPKRAAEAAQREEENVRATTENARTAAVEAEKNMTFDQKIDKFFRDRHEAPLRIEDDEQPNDEDSPQQRKDKIAAIEVRLLERARRTVEFMDVFKTTGYGRRYDSEGGIAVENVGDIRKVLKEMEVSNADVKDLTLNSRKFAQLFQVILDINDRLKAFDEGDTEALKKSIVITGKDGHFLDNSEIVNLRTEIKMRCFLNDLYLATSDAHDIESMTKTIIAFHKGDSDKTLDKLYIDFFLKSKDRVQRNPDHSVIKDRDGKDKKEPIGSANGLFVDIAWDLRQEAYFNYGGRNDPNNKYINDINDRPPGLLNNIVRSSPRLLDQYIEDYISKNREECDNYVKSHRNMTEENARRAFGEDKFLGVALLMSKSEQYNIEQNYYTNFRNDLDLARKDIVKNYMIEQIKKKVLENNPKLKGEYTNDDAERAYELARKLSVATYTDSAANIAFADGDDYAELVMFKAIRYQDGVEAKNEGKGAITPKNKPVGSVETIKFIDTLTPTWLATYAKKTSNRGIWKPLYADDIDVEEINPKAESTYHFGSIVFKKVQEAKMILMKSPDPKETTHPDKVQQAFDRLTKTISEARKAGWDVINPKYFDIEKGTVRDKAREQQFFRFIYTLGIVERATRSPLFGWTREIFNQYEELLMRGHMLADTDGSMNGTFISKEQMKYIIDVFNPRGIFHDMDQRKRHSPR